MFENEIVFQLCLGRNALGCQHCDNDLRSLAIFNLYYEQRALFY